MWFGQNCATSKNNCQTVNCQIKLIYYSSKRQKYNEIQH